MAKKATVIMDVQTGQSVKNINDINNELNETVQVSKSLKAQLREMTNELANLEPGTQRFNELSIAAGKLRDQISDTSAVIQATAGSSIENLGVGFTKVAGVGINAFQGIASAQALFGNESEELQKTLVKLQALAGLSEAVKGLGGLKDTLTEVRASFMAALKSSALFNTVTTTQTTVTGQATVATKLLGGAMKALPIVAIIAGIGAIVAAMVMFSKEASAADFAQEKLKESIEDYKKGATDAATKTNEVATSFTLAKKGVISKKEALDKYNSTLGDTFGKAKDLNEAEKMFNDKTEAFIKSSALRAQAQALMSISAEETAKGISASLEDQTTFWDKVTLASANYFTTLGGNYEGLIKDLEAKQKQRVKETQKSAKERADALNLEVTKLLEQAGEVEKKAGIMTDAQVKAAQEAEQKKVEAKRKANEEKLRAEEEYNNALKAFNDKVEADRQARIKDNQEKELQELANQYDEMTALADKAGKDTVAITEQYQKDIIEVNKKYAEIRKKEAQDKDVIKVETDINNIRLKMRTANAFEFVLLAEELKKKELSLLDEQMEAELLAVGDNEEQKLKIISEYALKRADLETEQKNRYKETTQEQKEVLRGFAAYNELVAKDAAAGWKAFQEEWKDDWVGTLGTLLEGVANTIAQVSDLFQQAFDEQNARAQEKIDSRYNASTEALNAQLADRLISEETYNNQVILLEQQKAQEELALKRKAFQQTKRIQILNATIQGAQAVLAGFSSGMAYPLIGPATGAIFAGIAAAMVATQVGIIASQQFRAARGGVVPGSGPSTIDSVPSLLAPGEMVINANSAGMFPELLSSINQAGGGISLAPNTSSISQTATQNQNSQPQVVRAYVVETEITDTQKRVSRLERASQFG